jgi:hypothetical protein
VNAKTDLPKCLDLLCAQSVMLRNILKSYTLLTQYRLQVLVTSRLRKAVGEGVELSAVGKREIHSGIV